MAADRQILTAPDAIARAAAPLAPEREQRWMLKQPRELRASFAREVLLPDPEAPREMIWMLFQDDATCRSYARYVLERDDAGLPAA